MNIIQKGLLNFVLLPNKIYAKMGINTAQLRSILWTKLTIDDRAPSAIMKMRKSNKKEHKNLSWATIIMSALMGLIFLTAFAVTKTHITEYTMYFSMFMFMVLSTLISDLSGILIDTKDNYIILPKPVNAKTFAMARMLHIFIHMMKVTIPMSLPGIIFVFIQHGILSGIAFAVMLFFSLLLTIFFVNAFYLFILKVTTAEKFKSLIGYIQIAIAIVMYAMYTLLPKFSEKYYQVEYDISQLKWITVVPPYWFAGGTEILSHGHGSIYAWIGCLLAVCVPAFAIVFVVKYLAPSFSRKLGEISNSADAQTKPVATKNEQNRKGLAQKMANLFTQKGTERAGFLLTWKLSGRLRDFKMKVFPLLGYMVVYIFMLSFQGKKHLSFEDIQNQNGRGKILFIGIIYSCSLFLLTALTQMGYSEKFKAAWIYYTTPIAQPGKIIAGGVKAIIFKFFVPIILLTTVTALTIVGIKIVPNIILGICNVLILCLLLVYIGTKRFPFSSWQGNENKTGQLMRGLAQMAVIAVFAIVHYFIYSMFIVVLISSILALAAAWYVYTSIRDLTWDKILQADLE